jgi:hypothetical protein
MKPKLILKKRGDWWAGLAVGLIIALATLFIFRKAFGL